jgi:hypothetical protein
MAFSIGQSHLPFGPAVQAVVGLPESTQKSYLSAS